MNIKKNIAIVSIIFILSGCDLVKPLPGNENITLGKEGLGIDVLFDKFIAGVDKFKRSVELFRETGEYRNSKEVELSESLGFEVVFLESMIDNGGSGSAERMLKSGQYSLKIAAELKTPKDGFRYEAWIVRSSPLDFKSVGTLIYEPDEQYHLSYIVNNDFMDYDKVVVTLENQSEFDSPSVHYLEGYFVQE